MSFAGNPFTSAPRLPSPVKKSKRLSLHARTASRSPVRPRDVDSLLRDLSPTTTLRAFRADPNSPDMAFGSSNADIIARSIESSSESERALGAKAAQACLDLRTWLREMEGWNWPGSFDLPEPVRKRIRAGEGVLTGDDGEEYWGSLPAQTVRAYEQRADEIGQLLDDMDVEELKDYVLSSHYRNNSRPPSRSRRLSAMSTLDMVTSDMKRLDDFTALVTATILQALPFLSHLNRLLDLWTIRLIILRSAPQYLRDLARARAELDQAWTAISASSIDGSDFNEVTVARQTVFQLKSSLEYKVGTLGRKLDRFLDDLEGRDDRVPDSWIDDFENIEAAFGAWAAQADRRVLESEWRLSKDAQSTRRNTNNNEQVSELEVPSLDADAVRRLSSDTSLPTDPFASFDQAAGVNQRPLSPSFDAVPIPVSQGAKLAPQPTNADNSNTRSISERLSLNVEEPSSTRSVSDSAASDETSGGLIAKRRAAFLNDIERTNSLKLASKSPVRSFEHASNAFTKLFKKDRSPEKARPAPKRSGSSKSGLGGQFSTSALAASIGSPSPEAAEKPRSDSDAENREVPTADSSKGPSPATFGSSSSSVQGRSDSREKSPEPVYQVQNATGSAHGGPETYRPSQLSSPFASPDKAQVPADWPLSGPSDSVLSEKQEQRIQRTSTPSTVPHAEPASTPQPTEMGRLVHTDVIVDPSTRDNERQSRDVHTPLDTDIYDTASPTTALQTDAFDRMFVESLPQPPPETPGSANAPERAAPWTGSRRRHSLPRPQRGSIPGLLRRSSISSSYLDNEYGKTSPLAPEPGAPDSRLNPNIPGAEEDERRWVKRASATFIEAFPRSELKSINVSRSSVSSPRRSSSGPAKSPPRAGSLPEETVPAQPDTTNGSIKAIDTCSINDDGLLASPSPPFANLRADNAAESATPYSPACLMSDSLIDAPSPAAGVEPESPLQSAPLNAAMMKRRGNNNNEENKAPVYTLSPASPSKKTGQSKQSEDSFDRHVSEVINTLPAPIKFRSRPGAETPVHQYRTGENRASLGPRPKNPPTARAPSRAGMMIAPAESSPKKSSSASDPEVKLYHLTQAGRDEPIKLFVRLVGEGERVMVRVGGGWADLADYLRQYAEHHGSRTVSDGGLEMQTALNGHSRRISGPVELKARPAPATPASGSGGATPLRPESRDSEKDWSQFSGLRDATNASPFSARAQTPSLYGTNTRSSTPKSSSGSSNSRPSTANGAGGPGSSRPSSRQSNTTDFYGLAGPSSTGKRGVLPDHKAKWVDSMIERAKASAEKSKEGAAKEKYFGELGKAGGTRRLVFRSGSGSGVVDKK